MVNDPIYRIRRIIRESGETRTPGRVLTADPTRAARFFDPRTKVHHPAASDFARRAVRRFEDARNAAEG